jgi:hypothetical protein
MHYIIFSYKTSTRPAPRDVFCSSATTCLIPIVNAFKPTLAVHLGKSVGVLHNVSCPSRYQRQSKHSRGGSHNRSATPVMPPVRHRKKGNRKGYMREALKREKKVKRKKKEGGFGKVPTTLFSSFLCMQW